MNSLIEYNKLMNDAGFGDVAKLQQEVYKPDITEMWIPAYLQNATKKQVSQYIRNKRYREADGARQYLVNYRKQTVQCACGMTVTKPNISSHRKSKRCKDRIKALALVSPAPVQTTGVLQESEPPCQILF